MLRRAGYEDVTVFEKGERVGGVWSNNTYPGAACDVPSHLYEFSFAPNRWTRRFAPQTEIQAYLEEVARRFGLRDRIRTGHRGDERALGRRARRWVLETSAGRHQAEILITACGQLSIPKVPPIPGLDSFDGPAFHTAEWRHDVDLAGRRVAVIGTGCSAIQAVPAIQPLVAQVDRLPTVARVDGAEERLRLPRVRPAAVRPLPGAASPRPRLDLSRTRRGRRRSPATAGCCRSSALPHAARSPGRSRTPSCAAR